MRAILNTKVRLGINSELSLLSKKETLFQGRCTLVGISVLPQTRINRKFRDNAYVSKTKAQNSKTELYKKHNVMLAIER